jgi:hypothetical protein
LLKGGRGDDVDIDITFIRVRKRKQLSEYSQAVPIHPSGKQIWKHIRNMGVESYGKWPFLS